MTTPIAPAFAALTVDDARYAWVKDLVCDRLRLLNLTRIGDHVYSMTDPQPELVALYPAIMVTSENERMESLPGTTEHQDWLVPVRVFLADRDTALRNQREPEWLRWHEAVCDAFHQQRLSGSPFDWRDGRPSGWRCYWCEAVPQVTYDHEAMAYRYVVGSILLKCWLRTPRKDKQWPT